MTNRPIGPMRVPDLVEYVRALEAEVAKLTASLAACKRELDESQRFAKGIEAAVQAGNRVTVTGKPDRERRRGPCYDSACPPGIIR